MTGYNNPGAGMLKNYFEVISNKLTIQGFIVIDYLPRAGEAIEFLSKMLKDGKLSLEGSETVVEVPFEEIVCAFA